MSSSEYRRQRLSGLLGVVVCGLFLGLAAQTFAFSGPGAGTAADPYQISNVGQLQEMKDDLTAQYVLVTDIDAALTSEWNGGKGFEPVGLLWVAEFTGVLDGRGYVINRLFISRSADYMFGVGLFGCIGAGGRVSNVVLTDVSVEGYGYTGSLIGYNDGGQVVRCYATGETVGFRNVGGLVGGNRFSGAIEQCAALVNVAGLSDNVGGLVGYNDNDGIIHNCFAAGDVMGVLDNTGGLVGGNIATIENSYAVGNVHAAAGAGGLVGINFSLLNEKALIRNSFATGKVTPGGGGLVAYQGSYDAVDEPEITGCFYNNTSDNPIDGIGNNAAASVPDITGIDDYVEYFYDNANGPLSDWDFENIWGFTGGQAGESYPELKFYLGDTTAPVISSITVDPAVIWPPNHKMVKAMVTVVATDDQDPEPVCAITGVEIQDEKSDLEDVGVIDGMTVMLRAERSGRGDGRVYVINVSSTDAQGNVATGTVNVVVPHDKGKSKSRKKK